MKSLIKKYLPYVIIISLLYLVMPVFFQEENRKYDFIEYQFLFPGAALVCGVVFSWKNGLDFTFPLFAPIIYIGSVLIYSHYYHWHIYTFIYLILGMLGCFMGDMVYRNETLQKSQEIFDNEKDNKSKITFSGFTVEAKEDEKAESHHSQSEQTD